METSGNKTNENCDNNKTITRENKSHYRLKHSDNLAFQPLKYNGVNLEKMLVIKISDDLFRFRFNINLI